MQNVNSSSSNTQAHTHTHVHTDHPIPTTWPHTHTHNTHIPHTHTPTPHTHTHRVADVCPSVVYEPFNGIAAGKAQPVPPQPGSVPSVTKGNSGQRGSGKKRGGGGRKGIVNCVRVYACVFDWLWISNNTH